MGRGLFRLSRFRFSFHKRWVHCQLSSSTKWVPIVRVVLFRLSICQNINSKYLSHNRQKAHVISKISVLHLITHIQWQSQYNKLYNCNNKIFLLTRAPFVFKLLQPGVPSIGITNKAPAPVTSWATKDVTSQNSVLNYFPKY